MNGGFSFKMTNSKGKEESRRAGEKGFLKMRKQEEQPSPRAAAPGSL